MKTVLLVFGTRPEAIKLAPVVRELENRPGLSPVVCVTGQHREMLRQVLDVFNIHPDYDLGIMAENQSLSDVTTRVLTGLERVLDEVAPDVMIVQGDTTTAMAASLAAYYAQVPVAHVEAGLRTGDKYSPFPEEINRRFVDVLADIHFAPTEHARENLLREGVDPRRVHVTGNSGIDALLHVARNVKALTAEESKARGLLDEVPSELLSRMQTDPPPRMILVTGHRRESFGERFRAICHALREIVTTHRDVEMAYPVHLNPNVRTPVYEILGGVERIHLFDPPGYPAFVWLLSQSYLVLTDSGGVQEEAPSLGKPALVMREVTERPEGVEAGCARIVGVATESIVSGTACLLEDSETYGRMSKVSNPYGDGRAASRIVDATEAWLGRSE